MQKFFDYSFLVIISLFLYLEVSTLLYIDKGEINPFVGELGNLIANVNQDMFGYLSFLNPFFFIYISYKIFYGLIENIYEFIISYFLLSFSLLILQSLLFTGYFSGSIGNNFVLQFNYLFGYFASFIFIIIYIPISIRLSPINLKNNLIFKNNNRSFLSFFKSLEVDSINKKFGNINIYENKNVVSNNFIEKKEKTKKQKNKKTKYNLPSIKFLEKPIINKNKEAEDVIDFKIMNLLSKLRHFKIEGDIVNTFVGPVVSTFEFKPNASVKVSKISNLQDDLAMSLKAETIRIQAPIPGKDVIGIEIPNDNIEMIYLRELLDSKEFKDSSKMTITLGKDINGKPYMIDVRKLPHLLIAGTTGSGKSVGLNAIILSLLYKNNSKELKFLMIDPKMLEFSIYNDIPHLITPVITKPKEAITALNNMIIEMENRYELMSKNQTKNIEGYNNKVEEENKLPYIVIIIDELADLMMTSGKDVEISIARLAQMARAAGIHLIVATQRPSTDVVTGLIKANLPSRISFRVGQKIDSKIILDKMGAESLLGRGDMLFNPPSTNLTIRLHAPYTSEEEIEKIVEFLKSQEKVNYNNNFFKNDINMNLNNITNIKKSKNKDELFEEAKSIILSDKKTSISYLQRKLRIGYNRSASIIEDLELEGFLSKPNQKGKREII